jgi:pimeloyl-ACP methyl ester carboxylesterase
MFVILEECSLHATKHAEGVGAATSGFGSDEVPVSFEVEIEGLPMSGLILTVPRPRGVILALHGGGATPQYYDAPGHPAQSMLRAGAANGYTVIAPFRPGYARHVDLMTQEVSAREQVDATYALVDALVGDDTGAGLFLLGHSQGCILTMRMAADGRGSELLGVEISGTGVTHQDQVTANDDDEDPRVVRRRRIHELLWTPEDLYLTGVKSFVRPPEYEGPDAIGWPAEFPRLAAQVTVPVRISLADHEYWWRAGRAGLEELAQLFAVAPRVVCEEHERAGHNISVGVNARAYHLKVLAFAEECRSAR